MKRFGLCLILSLLVVAPLAKEGLGRSLAKQTDVLPNLLTREKRVQASQFVTEAETFRSEWKEQSLREAISKYKQAAAVWQQVESPRDAAEAFEAAGELHFLLSEYYQALDCYVKALTIRQFLKDDLGITGALERMGYTYAYLGQNQRALEYLRRARSYLDKLGPTNGNAERMNKEAQLINSLGEVYYSLSDVKKAFDCFSRALNIWKTVGNSKGEALANLNLGYMYQNFGDLKGAQEHYDLSLSLWIAEGDKRGEALAHTAMGGIHFFLGEQQAALDLHNQALSLFRFIGDRGGEAATLNGIGTAYEGLNRPYEALDNYEAAMKLYRAIGNSDYEALAKFYIGAVHRSLGSTNLALDYYKQSLLELRRVGDRRLETYVLRDLASMYNKSGQTQRALTQYAEVLKLYDRFEDKRGQATTLNSIGDIYNASGQAEKAIVLYKRALVLTEAAQDRGAQIITLYGLARAERKAGDIGHALSRIEESIRLVESLRVKAGDSDRRASYFAIVHRNYEEYVDLLMDMHSRKPSEDFAAMALNVSERSRARSLLEMLAAARVDLRRDADPGLLERADSLERTLDAKAEYKMRVLSGNHSEDDTQAIDRDVRELASRYEEVQRQIREQSAVYVTLTQPKLLDLKDIQYQLGDSTLLLEYALGEERSYLFAVSSNSFASYELPGRSALEDLAQEVYSLLTARQPKNNETQSQSEERISAADQMYWPRALVLSRILLGPVAAELGGRRLVIVADGALQYLPFEALPIEASDQRTKRLSFAAQGLPENMVTLVTEHEIAYLQSSSMLAALRRDKKVPQAQRRGIVVLADPVFTREDSRVPAAARKQVSQRIPESVELQRSLTGVGEQGGELTFSRLPSTLQEAKLIVKAAPFGSTEVLTGFRANKSATTSATFGSHQILHFATHGIINNENPELSGVVLSLIDDHGNRQSGFLRLADIYKLNLTSDLVVLSACRSGLGKQLNGEGFVGLTRGFMSAGARSLVVSLWKVDDEATAELMGHFYEAMLREGLPPAAALQRAKQAMQADPHWHHPYYWAGFVLEGEYRETIDIQGTGIIDALMIGAILIGFVIIGFYTRVRKKKVLPSP